MVKVDLITGFLGSGKTTFIKKYASWLMKQGQNIGILENDFGAVNVDMMLLHDLEGENCELEMVSGIIVQEERSVPLFHIASKCADLHSDSVPYMSASNHDPPEAL